MATVIVAGILIAAVIPALVFALKRGGDCGCGCGKDCAACARHGKGAGK